jgi:hypothetical protein
MLIAVMVCLTIGNACRSGLVVHAKLPYWTMLDARNENAKLEYANAEAQQPQETTLRKHRKVSMLFSCWVLKFNDIYNGAFLYLAKRRMI